MLRRIAPAALIGAALLLGGCQQPHAHFGEPGEPLARAGDEIMVCGHLYHTGAPVVLWTDRGGYDAYRAHCHFKPDEVYPAKAGKNPSAQRYGTFRRHLPPEVTADVASNGWSLPELQEYVDLFVLHYDVCGVSRQCFKVLQDMRGLSVHFMLDLDGTIYQTLDLKERAWHAGSANDRSVGVEIANIGAYPNMNTLDKWYGHDADGRTYVTLPRWLGDGGMRTKGFVARPARNAPVVGEVQGKEYRQYDLTDAQYASLIKLTATLCQVLPRIRADYPRDAEGALRTSALSDEELAQFSGVLGHYHITTRKIDPGPALDWDRLMRGVHRALHRQGDTNRVVSRGMHGGNPER
ncbi:MAG TPA: N-acetylmuramoyl-L-alanine amidase [Phycisphaerae bacterium]|nr:N-acetylmuramoyl-L-alanine amidase [Phycisphaerales bacterium]HRX85267.1 N-acetylmuramoyl-L-alanine amidase [Phycisphaerae bacterium]